MHTRFTVFSTPGQRWLQEDSKSGCHCAAVANLDSYSRRQKVGCANNEIPRIVISVTDSCLFTTRYHPRRHRKNLSWIAVLLGFRKLKVQWTEKDVQALCSLR